MPAGRPTKKEYFKEIPGYEKLYMVSNFGRIKSLRTGRGSTRCGHPDKILTPSICGSGYYTINLFKNGKRKTFLVHRVVAHAFGILKPKQEINHIDGNKLNNCASNLESCTSKQNSVHAGLLGRIKRGSHRHNAKLNDSNIKKIIKFRTENKLSYREIGKLFAVAPSTIRGVCIGKTWNHVSNIAVKV